MGTRFITGVLNVQASAVLVLWLGASLLAAHAAERIMVSNVPELENAVNYANSRDNVEIVLKNGVYTLNDALMIWGNSITVRGESGNRDAAQIYGRGMTGSVSHIFNVAGTAFTARDLTIGRVANHAVQIWGNQGSSNTVLYNLHIVDTYEQMVKISYDAARPDRSSNGRMENCLLEYTAGVGPQYYTGGIDGHYCLNWIVRGNTFKNIASPSESLAEHAVHFWSNSENTLVEKNIIINCDRGIGFGLGDRGHTGGMIRNNFIYHSNRLNTEFADVGIGLENASGVKVYNNTIYFENDYPYAVEYRFNGTRGGIIYNNLTNRGIQARDGGSASLATNITDASASWFRGVSSGDLHLVSAVSRVTDRGTAVSGLTEDIDGDSRPQGGGIDIGADEYRETSHLTARIQINRSAFYYGGFGSNLTPSQYFHIRNSGSGTMNWTVSESASWLICTPSAGSGSGAVKMRVSTSGLDAGDYSAAIRVSSPEALNSPQTVTVYLHVIPVNQDQPPFGSFDSPAQNAAATGNIAVTGWALDDAGITVVKLFRLPIAGESGNPIQIGAARFVEGARPDVETAYPGYPLNYQAGWGYMMLTNFLPNGGNGDFTFYIEAEDLAGQRKKLGQRTIRCRNASAVKPFGTIETPDQGETVYGETMRNWGWVLTPPPDYIPYSGATISVWVDGKNLGKPSYGFYRSDVAALFPGYANKDGAFGYYDLNLAKYNDGIHTIQWVATDSSGHTDGLGSRYFTIRKDLYNSFHVQNREDSTGDSFPPLHRGEKNKGNNGPVYYTTGYAAGGGTRLRAAFPDGDGVRDIPMSIDDRLEVHLGTPVTAVWPENCAGASLNRETGMFYWQPGPVFYGKFLFVFPCIHREGMIKIRVTICKRGE